MTLPQFEGGLLGGTLFEEEPLEGPLLVEASWASLALLVEQIWEAWESYSRDRSLEMDLRCVFIQSLNCRYGNLHYKITQWFKARVFWF